MPNCFARLENVAPSSRSFRMARTLSSVSFALPARSPRAGFRRPFALASAMFSVCVPRNRWAGFTQARLSQRWQTKRPSGIGPTKASYDKRCARQYFRSIRMVPYPWLPMARDQTQHSLVASRRHLDSIVRFRSTIHITAKETTRLPDAAFSRDVRGAGFPIWSVRSGPFRWEARG